MGRRVDNVFENVMFIVVFNSVKKTGKVIVLQEDTLFNSIASELSAVITENCFEYLDAPVKRIGSIETPIPFNTDLERQYLAKERFSKELTDLLKY